MIEVMTTSTTELGAGLFEIYPVPFNDILVVDFKMNMGSIQLELFDLNGRLLLQKTLDGFSKYNLDLDQLTSGAYQLRLQNEMGTWVRKVVKAN